MFYKEPLFLTTLIYIYFFNLLIYISDIDKSDGMSSIPASPRLIHIVKNSNTDGV